MLNKILGLFGAVAALTPAAGVAAPVASSDVAGVQSYADLLKPIPNAAARLQAEDAVLRSDQDAAKLEMAQFYHHHHHHHRFFRRFYHHHHHHFFRRRYHHHHHYY